MNKFKHINDIDTIDFFNNKGTLVGFIDKKKKIAFVDESIYEEEPTQEMGGLAMYASMPVYTMTNGELHLVRSNYGTIKSPKLKDTLKSYEVMVAKNLQEATDIPSTLHGTLKKLVALKLKNASNFVKMEKQIMKDLQPFSKAFGEAKLNIGDAILDDKNDKINYNDKKTLLKLINEANPELVMRIIKQIDPSFKQSDLISLTEHPSKFIEIILNKAKKEEINLNDVKSRFSKIKKAFNDHFDNSLSLAARWQKKLFDFEVKIVAAYLAYASIKNKMPVSKIIIDLINNLDPTDLRFTKQKEFTESSVLSSLLTIGFVAVLIMLAVKGLKGN